MTYDIAIIGGGIVGLATALAVQRQRPGARVVLLEKEDGWALHQTGRNSGVIHSGIYYRPGSLKARFARKGSRSLVRFCEEQDLPVDVCGKVIVATRPEELPRLEALYERGRANGLRVHRLTAEEVAEREPHVNSLAGIHVPSTGITDYRRVAMRMAELAIAAGAELRLGSEVRGLAARSGTTVLHTARGAIEARYLVNCAGLHSDRVARLGGARPAARIVPFRGEYFELVPERRYLVKNLIYPVPDPAFPFLGVHFTRMADGGVHAGPNAVLSLKREGYRKRDVSLRDTAEVLAYPGFWRLAARHAGTGVGEMVRSHLKAAFVRSLQRLIPELRAEDIVPSPAGVRAQALTPQGGLVDDFLIEEQPGALHVLNAPSPAATSSLEIAAELASRLPPDLGSRPAMAVGWSHHASPIGPEGPPNGSAPAGEQAHNPAGNDSHPDTLRG